MTRSLVATFSFLKEISDDQHCVWKICGKANWSASKLQPRIDLLHLEFDLFSLGIYSSYGLVFMHLSVECVEKGNLLVSGFLVATVAPWDHCPTLSVLTWFEEGDRFNEPPSCCHHHPNPHPPITSDYHWSSLKWMMIIVVDAGGMEEGQQMRRQFDARGSCVHVQCAMCHFLCTLCVVHWAVLCCVHCAVCYC